MTADEEVATGEQLLALEARLRTVLDRHPSSAAELARPVNSMGKLPSRGLLADRMSEAARDLWSLSRRGAVILADGPDHLRSDAREAMRLVSELDALRWELVMSVQQVAGGEAVKKYGITGSAVSVEDVNHDGLVGLYWAACRWDPARGLRFATYACWWVKSEVQRAESEMQHCVTIRRRGHEARLMAMKIVRHMEAQGTSHGEALEQAGLTTGYSAAGIQQLLVNHQAYSLDDPVPWGRDDSGPMARRDLMTAPEVDLLEGLHAERRRQRIEDLLGKLGDDRRLERIVRLRFGLDGDEPETLAQISHRFKVTRERIRQLVLKALRLMRGGRRSSDTTSEKGTRMTTRIDQPLPDRILAALLLGDASTRELSQRLLGSIVRKDTNAIRASCHRMSQPDDGRVVKVGDGRSTRWQRASPKQQPPADLNSDTAPAAPPLASSDAADIDLPPQALQVLARLEGTGMFGATRAEVARTLLLERVRQLVREGW